MDHPEGSPLSSTTASSATATGPPAPPRPLPPPAPAQQLSRQSFSFFVESQELSDQIGAVDTNLARLLLFDDSWRVESFLLNGVTHYSIRQSVPFNHVGNVVPGPPRVATLPADTRLYRVDRCRPCTMAGRPCNENFPACDYCVAIGAPDQCTTHLRVHKDYLRNYVNGTLWMLRLGYVRNVVLPSALSAAPTVPSMTQQLAPPHQQLALPPQQQTTAPPVQPQATFGRLHEAPPIETMWHGNSVHVTLPELLTFLPHAIRRRTFALRLAEAGWSYGLLTAYMNIARNYFGKQKRLENTNCKAYEWAFQNEEYGLGQKKWTFSIHSSMRAAANTALANQAGKPEVKNEQKTPILLRSLAEGVYNWPDLEDRGLLTPAIEEAVTHPDVDYKFTQAGILAAVSAATGVQQQNVTPQATRSDDISRQSFSAWWQQYGAQWRRDHKEDREEEEDEQMEDASDEEDEE